MRFTSFTRSGLVDLARHHRGRPIWRFRDARLAEFVRRVSPPPGAHIVDLGGLADTWTRFEHDYHVTLVNLPGSPLQPIDSSRYTVVMADACDLRDRFDDGAFDVVFSNSVIEHVGDSIRRAAFAREVRRLAPAYWVQTPSEDFPIEAHTGVPYYFRLPPSVRERLHRRWAEKLPEWYEMITQTTVLSAAELRALFPGAEEYRERLIGLEKSYSFYRPYVQRARAAG